MASLLPLDRTLIQEGDPYDPRYDLRTDAVMVYGVDPALPERVAAWRARGYRTHLMIGLAWGTYQDYVLGKWDGRDHWDDAQRNADGTPKLHGRDIPYITPSESYAAYLETLLRQAIAAGVEAIYLEEPEFWAATGYGAGFERAWEARYGRPYRDPAADPEAFSLAAELKRALYRELIERLCTAVYRITAGLPGGPLPCYVATHSLLNYAHNRIVSPLSSLREIEHLHGAIVQTWSHTARSQVLYESRRGEQLFEVAFLEYASGLELVRGTDRRLWFLADPVEDRPTHGWDRYRQGYRATLVASLFQPQVGAYEVMPWPMRVFTGRYPRRPEGPPGDPIPPTYAAELLAVANALSAMPEGPLVWDCGTQGLGVLMADSLMFRRGGPLQDDPELSAFYGLALPLLRAGMPVQPLSLEAVGAIGVHPEVRVLLLAYDGMTPPEAQAHHQLAAWVRAGNALLLFGQADGPYETLPGWWNEGRGGQGPWPHLCRALGIEATPGLHRVGEGAVLVVAEGPIALARREDGAQRVRACLREVLTALGERAPAYREQRYLTLRRGPYLLAAALGEPDETAEGTLLEIRGRFVDMLDGDLPVRRHVSLRAGEQAWLLDLDRVPGEAAVLAASGRVDAESATSGSLGFRLAGPAGTPAVIRLRLPAVPVLARAGDESLVWEWEAETKTALLRHENQAEVIAYQVTWRAGAAEPMP